MRFKQFYKYIAPVYFLNELPTTWIQSIQGSTQANKSDCEYSVNYQPLYKYKVYSHMPLNNGDPLRNVLGDFITV